MGRLLKKISAQSENRTLLIRLSVLLFIVLCFRLYNLKSYDVMSSDGIGYATSGKIFFETWDPKVFGTVFPPLYPILCGISNLFVNDVELAARLVSIIFSVLTIIPLFLLTRELFSSKAAWCTILLYATLPFMHSFSGIDISEPTYTFLVVSGGYLFWRGYILERFTRIFGAGVQFGLAYLARPEGFITTVALTGIFILAFIVSRKELNSLIRLLIIISVLWVGFFSMALPYMYYLKAETGVWQLSGKTGLNTKIIREYYTGEVNDQHLQIDTKTGALVGGGQDSLVDLVINEPDIFWGNIRKNISLLPAAANSVFPPYLWMFVFLGLIISFKRTAPAEINFVLLALLAPVFLYVLFFVQPRGLYTYIPMLLVWTGGGLIYIDTALCNNIPRWQSAIPMISLLLVPLCTYYVYNDIPKAKPKYHYSMDGGRFDDKQIGIRLRSIIPKNSTIMTRSGRIAYYSQRRNCAPPQGSFLEINTFARRNNVEYLIATIDLLQRRPQLEQLYGPIFAPDAPYPSPPGFKLEYKGEESGGTPYLVYRLLPLPQ